MSEYKGYNLVPMGTFPFTEIKAIGSGPVPTPLRGYWTTITSAMKAVDAMLAEVNKEPNNGKTKSNSKD
jgi:hypothetical protein